MMQNVGTFPRKPARLNAVAADGRDDAGVELCSALLNLDARENMLN